MNKVNKIQRFYLQWHITNKCNLKCLHCYQKKDQQVCKESSVEELEKVVNVFEHVANKWNISLEVSLTGGEPFTKKKHLYFLLFHLQRKNFVKSINILTNGALINDDDINKLHTIKKLRAIQISLDGHNNIIHDSIRGNGSFKTAIESIKNLKKNKLFVSVMMTLSKKNYLHIRNVYNLLKKLGVDSFGADRFIPFTESNFDTNILSSKEMEVAVNTMICLKKNGNSPAINTTRPLYCLSSDAEEQIGGPCSIGNGSLCLLPDGTALACRRLPIPLGNILVDGFYSIWYGSRLLWNIRNKDNLKNKCHNCSDLTSCGGCRAMAYALTNDYLEEDPSCWK